MNQEIYLKGDVIAEANGGERNEAVVKAVEVAPTLVMREHCRAGQDDDGRKEARRHR